VLQQRIDHHVAHEPDAPGCNAFAQQIIASRALGRIQQVRDLVGQDAIDFLRHLAVETAHPGLDMDDPRALLGRDETACQRGIDVPTTMTQLGASRSKTGSKRRMISAVCTQCVPEPLRD
jgi:hypothetical protein